MVVVCILKQLEDESGVARVEVPCQAATLSVVVSASLALRAHVRGYRGCNQLVLHQHGRLHLATVGLGHAVQDFLPYVAMAAADVLDELACCCAAQHGAQHRTG